MRGQLGQEKVQLAEELGTKDYQCAAADADNDSWQRDLGWKMHNK